MRAGQGQDTITNTAPTPQYNPQTTLSLRNIIERNLFCGAIADSRCGLDDDRAAEKPATRVGGQAELRWVAGSILSAR